jgi:hypothetical protein
VYGFYIKSKIGRCSRGGDVALKTQFIIQNRKKVYLFIEETIFRAVKSPRKMFKQANI